MAGFVPNPKSQISQNLWGGWVHKIGSFVLNKTVSRLVFDHICFLPEEVKSETLRSNRKYDWKALFREFSQFSFQAMPESLMIGFTGRWSGKMLHSVGANFLHTTAPQCIGSHTSGKVLRKTRRQTHMFSGTTNWDFDQMVKFGKYVKYSPATWKN